MEKPPQHGICMEFEKVKMRKNAVLQVIIKIYWLGSISYRWAEMQHLLLVYPFLVF